MARVEPDAVDASGLRSGLPGGRDDLDEVPNHPDTPRPAVPVVTAVRLRHESPPASFPFSRARAAPSCGGHLPRPDAPSDFNGAACDQSMQVPRIHDRSGRQSDYEQVVLRMLQDRVRRSAAAADDAISILAVGARRQVGFLASAAERAGRVAGCAPPPEGADDVHGATEPRRRPTRGCPGTSG